MYNMLFIYSSKKDTLESKKIYIIRFMSLICFQFQYNMYAKNSICGRIFLSKNIIFLIWSYNKLQNVFLFVRTNPDPRL